MLRTFVDSGVLLAAARSVTRDRNRALGILEDTNRVFLTSPFVHLELIPKAAFYRKYLELAFYDEYFRAAQWFRNVGAILAAAQKEAEKSGLAAMDALHIAAAALSGADEFVTTERPGKPLYRSTSVKIAYVFE